MKVVGHIAQSARGQLDSFFLPGFGMVAHAEEFAFASDDMSDDDIKRFVGLAQRSGASLTSTLTVDERILEQMLSPDTLMTRPELRLVHPMLLRNGREQNRYIESANAERIAELERAIEFNRKLVAAFGPWCIRGRRSEKGGLEHERGGTPAPWQRSWGAHGAKNDPFCSKT
jgi:hypothetical protein